MTETMEKIVSLMSKNPDGCSIDPNAGESVMFATGYFVAITDNEMTEGDEKEIVKIGTLAKVLNLTNHYLGYWMDQMTGKRFLDLSVHVQDLNVALELAKMHNQKAIFDCAKLDCVYLNVEKAA